VGVVVQAFAQRGRRLQREHADGLLRRADRHANKRGIAVEQPALGQVIRIVGQARHHQGSRTLLDRANHALARTPADIGIDRRIDAVHRRNGHGVAAWLAERDQRTVEAALLVEHPQHLGQRFAQFERTRQHPADPIQRLQRRLEPGNALSSRIRQLGRIHR